MNSILKNIISTSLFPWAVIILLLFTAQGCLTQRSTLKRSFESHESGIKYRILKQGKGQKAEVNDLISVHYTLKLQDSTLVDSSYERGEPVFFNLGSGQVIQGWEIAMELLREGDKAELIVPPALAYGESKVGDIPPNSTLVFEVEVMKIEKPVDPFDTKKMVEYIETDSGLWIGIVERGKGIELKSGMQVRIHYTGYFEDMTSFDSSYSRGQPIDFTLGKGMVIRGWEEALTILRVGDKARISIPYQLAYGQSGRGPIPPETDLIFDVEVIDAQEVKRPDPFLIENQDTLQTESGLQYIIVNEGTEQFPKEGQKVRVHYTGFLLDGEIFDSSVERSQPFEFVLGRRQVIRGWDEGVALMGKGAKYRFIIPAELAYGSRALGPIPANATLVFDIELLDFK